MGEEESSKEIISISIKDDLDDKLSKINFENIFYSDDCDGVMEVKLLRALLTTYLDESKIEEFIDKLNVTDNITLLIIMKYLRGNLEIKKDDYVMYITEDHQRHICRVIRRYNGHAHLQDLNKTNYLGIDIKEVYKLTEKETIDNLYTYNECKHNYEIEQVSDCDVKYNDKFINVNHEVENLKMDLERSKQYYIACCCIPRKNRDHKLKIRRIINLLTLSPQKKAILLDRYVDLVNNYRIQSFWYSYTFNTLRFIIQIGSLLTPALLSIQHFYEGDNAENPIYWSTWSTSLMVGLLTNYINLFKLDKKFYSINKTYLKLVAEGWMFFELSGIYAKQNNENIIPTHNLRFNMFCNEIEKIRAGELEVRFHNEITNDEKNKSKFIYKKPKILNSPNV